MENFPQELYATVFSHLPPGDLVKVGTTSRSFHYETNRLLYRNVDLTQCSKHDIVSWANAVAQSPTLGGIVRTLDLPFIVPVRSYPYVHLHEMQTALKTAFGAVNNLISLEVTFRKDQEDTEHYLNFDIFSTSRFRLKSFCDPWSGLDSNYELCLFLSQQTEIEHWEPDSERQYPEEGFFSSSLLPCLTAFRMHELNLPLLKFAVSRPLVYLSIHVDLDEDEDDPLKQIMEHVYRCHHTLHHLNCSVWNASETAALPPPAERIGVISQRVPELRSLNYEQEKNWITDDIKEIAELTEAISKFTRLENLRMQDCTWRGMITMDDDSSEKGLAVARQLFQCCPTLRRICYCSEDQQNARASYRRLDGGEPAFDGTIGFDYWTEWLSYSNEPDVGILWSYSSGPVLR